jgi:uncharacterized protein (DUF1330 family)
MENPVFLVVHGKLKEGKEDVYTNYAKAVMPLLREFNIETIAIGAGIESQFTNETFPINIVMKLPNESSLEFFLSDLRYLEAKKYRDEAYEELHLSAFVGREPRKFD